MKMKQVYHPPRDREYDTDDGHKVFVVEDGRVLLADASGNTPGQTDEGPLIVDVSKKAALALGERGLTALIPVQVEGRDGEEGVVHTTIATLKAVQAHCPMQVEASSAVKTLAADLEAALTPEVLTCRVRMVNGDFWAEDDKETVYASREAAIVEIVEFLNDEDQANFEEPYAARDIEIVAADGTVTNASECVYAAPALSGADAIGAMDDGNLDAAREGLSFTYFATEKEFAVYRMGVQRGQEDGALVFLDEEEANVLLAEEDAVVGKKPKSRGVSL